MTTIPQLRSDIARLQDELRVARAELAAKPRVVERVVYRDVPTPGPERVVYSTPPERVVYRDNPAHLAMIRKLQGRT